MSLSALSNHYLNQFSKLVHLYIPDYVSTVWLFNLQSCQKVLYNKPYAMQAGSETITCFFLTADDV